MGKKLSIIVPYRNRKENLSVFIPSMKSFLNKIDYNLLIVEQYDDKLFNRARLLNIGFEFSKNNCDYVCFHDVDMIPVKADYSYPEVPIHMATNVSQFRHMLPYENYYGGVNLFNNKDFININGYSNEFWGWGGEDDDMLNRVKNKGYELIRRHGVYTSIELISGHIKSNHSNYNNNTKKLEESYNYDMEGLNTLKYKLIEELELENKVKIIKVV